MPIKPYEIVNRKLLKLHLNFSAFYSTTCEYIVNISRKITIKSL